MFRGWRILLVFAFLLGLSLALKAGLVAFAGYVLIGVYLLSRYLARRWITDISVERDCDHEPLEVGETFESTLLIKNTGAMPIGWILLEDMLPEFAMRRGRIEVKGRRIAVLFLRPLQEKPLKLKLTFLSRGYYPIGPCLGETGDVFGLHRRHRVLAPPVYVMVYPKIIPLPGYDFASRRPIGEVRLANRLFEDPTRCAGVRPYQMGDPLQRVHWRATARTGELHCRIYEPTSLAGATLVIDCHKDGYPKRGEPQRSDLAVTAACSIAYALSLLNQPVGLASNGRDAAERIRQESLEKQDSEAQFNTRFQARDRYEVLDQNNRLKPVVVETRRGFDQFQIIRESLARLELADGLKFGEFLLEVAPRLPKDATIIAILPQVPVETSLALGMLRRLGFAISVLLIGLREDGSDDRVQAAGRLLAEGIRDVRFLNNEQELALLGDRSAGPAPTDYALSADLI
jgi:uncharacterized protein (DUF58 family)